MTLVIRGVTVITNAESGVEEIIEHGRVVIEGTDIAEVGPDHAAGVPKDAQVLDAEGMTVLPGLINLHDHVARKKLRISEAGSRYRDQSDQLMRQPQSFLAYHTAANILAELRSGVTTIRDFGLPGVTGIQARRAVEAGVIPGPRLLTGGDPISITGGHGSNWGAMQADGPVGVTRAVRQQIIAGATCLKFMASGGLGTYPDEDPGIPELTKEELAAGIEEAHKFHKHTAAHAYSTESIKNAVLAGIDTIEHGAFLDDEAVTMMRERGVAHVPTISGLIAIAFQYRMIGNDAMAERILTEIIEPLQDSASRSWHAGIPVGTGTDTSGEVVEELELLQEATGATTLEVLRAATSTAARIARIDARTGSLEPGKAADVLVVDGDLVGGSLEVLRRPRWVLRDGVVHDAKPMPLGVRMSLLSGVAQTL